MIFRFCYVKVNVILKISACYHDIVQLNRILYLYKIVLVQRSCKILKDLENLDDYQQDLDRFSKSFKILHDI
jgi:hypothetical protein